MRSASPPPAGRRSPPPSRPKSSCGKCTPPSPARHRRCVPSGRRARLAPASHRHAARAARLSARDLSLLHCQLGSGVRLEAIVWNGTPAARRQTERPLFQPSLSPVERSQPFVQLIRDERLSALFVEPLGLVA